MKIESQTTITPSLHNLGQIRLTPLMQVRVDEVLTRNGGEPMWRARKAAEIRELAVLAQIAPERLEILEIDPRVSLHATLRMVVPVPCRPNGGGLVVAPEALLSLDYRQEAVHQPMPGYAFMHVIAPQNVWLANVQLPEQALCLGAKLPAGIRVRSLIQMTYIALSMQTYQVDPFDSAGVLNAEAATWWWQNLNLAPLTREPFLPERLGKEVA